MILKNIDKYDEYCKIKDKAMICKNCDLGNYDNGKHDQHVFGDGNLNSDIMFVAENPGKYETIHKECLSEHGVSGKVYKNILEFLGLTREDVYTANVLICKSEKNRDAELWEVKKCSAYLQRQIELIQPKLIVTFGRFAAQHFINNFKITKDHGKIFRSEKYNVNIFPVYHPAYYKAYASTQRRQEFKDDIKQLKIIVNRSFVERQYNESTDNNIIFDDTK